MAQPTFIEVQKTLSGVDYPVDRDGLVRHARSHQASDDIVRLLERIPNQTYDGPTAVSAAVTQESGGG
ncbi:DUF2795 domain-containing protein [Allonocardiopsis opalescens]|uniref:Uncharacterized protein DUF2795 n=1 Tax=Allonocardiopsis opalescens TaxID=1144618 RepID=A0A2T0PXM4_9ACTN|nr:DUF2795 domain-containing protein [Allonocardiopsis opalescens]PRX96188.1 uncharacterized protein DUF2795 [Allonocardiopsis opalescens]